MAAEFRKCLDCPRLSKSRLSPSRLRTTAASHDRVRFRQQSTTLRRSGTDAGMAAHAGTGHSQVWSCRPATPHFPPLPSNWSQATGGVQSGQIGALLLGSPDAIGRTRAQHSVEPPPPVFPRAQGRLLYRPTQSLAWRAVRIKGRSMNNADHHFREAGKPGYPPRLSALG